MCTSWYEAKKGGKNENTSKKNHPPEKNKIKCNADIIKWRYSAKKIINNIGPLYSVEYPATTSDSVSAWSNGARFDSRKSTTTNAEAAGAYINIYQ